MNNKTMCLIFAAAFIVPGVLGFIPNPLIAPDGLFAVNPAHNLVHLLTGAAFLVGGLVFPQYARRFIQVIGVAYVVVAIAGFLTPGMYLLGFIHINTADRWLHVGLATILLFAGFVPSGERVNRAMTA